MYNIFQNIKVESAKTDSSQGQFRYEVKLVRAFQDGRHGLVTDKEFVIDTTDDLGECLVVAQEMVKRANDITCSYCYRSKQELTATTRGGIRNPAKVCNACIAELGE